MSQFYDPDDALPNSPGLQPFKPKYIPSPSPPPLVTHSIVIPSPENVSSPSLRRRRKSNRRKTQPSLGDSVLIRCMGPNQPEVARIAGEEPLNSDSGSETDEEEEEDDMNVQSHAALPALSELNQVRPVHQDHQSILQDTARKALDDSSTISSTQPLKFPQSLHRDSVVEIDGQSRPNFGPETSNAQGIVANGARLGVERLDASHHTNGTSKFDATSPTSARERHGSITNGYPHEPSPATSPNLRQLTIPQPRGFPNQTLPALQAPHSPRHGPTISPNQERRLPSIKHINDIADTAISEQHDTGRTNSLPHRQSISSSNQSPTARHLSISSLSPASGYPLSATSPISAASETTSKDLFLRSGESRNALFSPRRPSQASDLQSNNDYQSSEGLSPGSQPTPIENQVHRMSIDGTLRTLPPPNPPHIHHIPPHGSNGFRCEHPGCNAPPFQTQYLLNSHANVHSQSRPHYCPVKDCPRSEGGKGFKRKNEMIRHGLVHASPGYVCPFCPDREHKYPRPDNLQRHVRVHHVDKDKDDAQLREVLSQRPEGGSRGRRRRVSS